MKKKLNWDIVLYSGSRELYSTEIPFGCASEGMIEGLLKTLVAKAGLTFDETVACYTKRNTKRHANHLNVTKKKTKIRYTITCGHDPYAVAVVNHGGITLKS